MPINGVCVDPAAITQANTCTGGADCVGACCQAKLPATCAVQFQADPALQCTAGEEPSATTMCVAGYNCTVDACCVPSPCRYEGNQAPIIPACFVSR
jgi:hypothetical protein